MTFGICITDDGFHLLQYGVRVVYYAPEWNSKRYKSWRICSSFNGGYFNHILGPMGYTDLYNPGIKHEFKAKNIESAEKIALVYFRMAQ